MKNLHIRPAEGRPKVSDLGLFAVVALVAAAVPLALAKPTPLREQPFPDSQEYADAAGLISYSVFLWHEPLVRWLREHGLTIGGAGGLAANTILVLTLTVALSAVTYRCVELPALRRKVGFGQPRHIPSVPPEQAQAAP